LSHATLQLLNINYTCQNQSLKCKFSFATAYHKPKQ